MLIARLTAAFSLLILLAPFPAPAAAPASQPALDPAIAKPVAAALKYIISRQHKDGAICDGDAQRTAITALAVMALNSAGVRQSQPTHEAAALRKAMAWILLDARLRPDGYFGNDGSWMYTHGVTTLMLAQMSHAGADEGQNALIGNRLRKGVDLILETQKNNQAGGWRYFATATDADLAVTLWQVRALAAARDAGLPVPAEAFSRAADFVKSCQSGGDGLAYVPGRPASWSDSAAGLLALKLCGAADSPEAKAGADFLQARPQPADRLWYLHGCVPYVLAMGASGRDDLETARQNVADTVLQWQKRDGSFPGWAGDADQGPVYCSAMVVLALTAQQPPPPTSQPAR